MRYIGSVLALILLVVAGQAKGDDTQWRAFARSQITPMSRNVYHEARGEPKLGQMMVAYITLMRAKANRSVWGGDTIEGVVYKKGQFSWTYHSGKKAKTPSGPAWDRAVDVATLVALGFFEPPPELLLATSYMNPDASSQKEKCRMATHLVQVGVVGNHYFYRELLPGEEVSYVPPRFNCTV
jgi:N-acetylmuramoyl-L-alanine amidase